MKSVLITGGTGSFGQAFTERLLKDDRAERICIFSRGEHAQAGCREKFKNDPRLRWFIGDVRDLNRLTIAMEECDTVVHGAALKRVDTCEENPTEATSINTGGTANVVLAAKAAGVKRAVLLSTDKAFEAVNHYGASKRQAETHFLAANNFVGARGPKFAVTRYGNVWKSRGSFIDLWQQTVRTGGKQILVTDPNCTRFFMLMDHAVDFVLTTLEKMPLEVQIPELAAYRIGDVADLFPGIEQKVIGLSAREKLHESMCEGRSSECARRMTIDELRAHL